MKYLITRHPGALHWLQGQISEPFHHLTHISDLGLIQPGDWVIGSLPLHLVADICVRGARYFHIDVHLPESLRGCELTAQQLTELDAEIVEYTVREMPARHI